ncbi:MAG TPA: type II toxin-antitoxin system death-on-curing family toxin [Opitutales bacterium]|jgi:death-on-curing protein|nr:type II toxin-antitoxin system death-on-curing family toxin [Opitutales bacterium]
MNEPLFLTAAQVEGFHRRVLELYGGLDGLRERALFKSAVTQAENVYWYGQGDLHAIAAAYAFHLAQAQAFFDGNKRTAVAAALAFLKLNGVDTRKDITAPLVEALIAVANHELDRDGLAILLRRLLPLQ